MYTYEAAKKSDVGAAVSNKVPKKSKTPHMISKPWGLNPVRHTAVNRTGLPDEIKSRIEKLSGIRLDDVRVHYNSPMPAQFRAFAYTRGNEIHVAAGQEKHLPHEAWHVVQQKQGRVQPTAQIAGMNINDSPELEREADVMGERAMSVQPTAMVGSLYHSPRNVLRTRIAQFREARAMRRAVTTADRHNIPAPNSLFNLARWAKTLMQERISTLFLTQRGLAGHATQIQQELTRLNTELMRFECDEDDAQGFGYLRLANDFTEQIKAVLIKFAAKAAYEKRFPFDIKFELPFNHVLSLKTDPQGHLLVNSKPYIRRSGT